MKTIPLNDLSRITRAEKRNLGKQFKELLNSGNFLNSVNNQVFRAKMSNLIGVKYVLGVASGTDALIIALKAIGCGNDSKVIVTANSGGYAGIAIAAIGGEIILADVDLDDGNMSPSSLENLIDDSVSAVVVTHLFGNPAKIVEIQEICRKNKVPLVEDCAQAIGAEYNGRKLGSFGLISTFSFYPTKNLGGIGDGGAICTNDIKVANLAQSISQYGWSTKKYEIQIQNGINSRLDEVQALTLNYRIQTLEESNQARRHIVERYTKALKGKNSRMLTKFDNGGVCHLAVLAIGDKSNRSVIQNQFLENCIETGIHYPKLDSDQVGFESYIKKEYDLLNSRTLIDKIITIPCFAALENYEIDYVCQTLEQYLD